MSATMPIQEFGPDKIPVSRIALGCMGLAGTWNPAEVGPENRKRAIASFEAALEAGITFYDHADIYGGTACESIFKDCLQAVPGSRERIFIATKVGIRSGYYDHSPEHIRQSVEGSLSRMGIEVIDLYQLHRPDPLGHPAQTAETLDALIAEGKIKAVGVSNYYPQQTLALQKYLQAPIISNQIAISLLHTPPIYEGREGQGGDGVLDQCEALGITPLAYSPVGGGWLSGRRDVPADHPNRERIERILAALRELAPSTTTPRRHKLHLPGCSDIPPGSFPWSAPTSPNTFTRRRAQPISNSVEPIGTSSGSRRAASASRSNSLGNPLPLRPLSSAPWEKGPRLSETRKNRDGEQ